MGQPSHPEARLWPALEQISVALSGSGFETSRDGVSSSSWGSLFPGCTTVLVGILFPSIQAEHSSVAPSCTFCYHWEEFGSDVIVASHHGVISCCSTAFGLLFIRLHKPRSSAKSSQWSCVLGPWSSWYPSTLALSSFLTSFLKWVAKTMQFSIFYLSPPYEIKTWESDLFHLK